MLSVKKCLQFKQLKRRWNWHKIIRIIYYPQRKWWTINDIKISESKKGLLSRSRVAEIKNTQDFLAIVSIGEWRVSERMRRHAATPREANLSLERRDSSTEDRESKLMKQDHRRPSRWRGGRTRKDGTVEGASGFLKTCPALAPNWRHPRRREGSRQIAEFSSSYPSYPAACSHRRRALMSRGRKTRRGNEGV